MNCYLKKIKLLFVIVTFVAYSSFARTAHAQNLGTTGTGIDASAVAACVANGAAVAAITQIAKTSALALVDATFGTTFGAAGGGAVLAGAGAGAAIGAISVPVSDAIAAGQRVSLGAVTAAAAAPSAGGSLTSNVVEPILETLAYNLGQCTINALTDSVVLWIQGGFNGSPNFDINTSQLFSELANTVSSNMSKEILGFDARGLALCDFSPTFKWDLSNSVSLSNHNNKKFAAQVRCPFGSGNLLNFSAANFYKAGKTAFAENGGFQSFEASLSDRGNPFGVTLATQRELATRQEKTMSVEEKKLARADGFLDIVDTDNCLYPDGSTALDPEIDWSEDPKGKKMWEKMYCNVTTPGKMVSAQLSKSLGISMDRLGLANNMDKIITALLQQTLKGAVNSILGKDNLPPSRPPQPITYVAISSTGGQKVAGIKSGLANQFANDPSCTNQTTCAAFTIFSNTSSTLSSIKITETGTVNASTDLSNLALFYDTDGSFSNGTTGQYGAVIPSFTSTETATVTSTLTLTPGTRYYFYVRFDAKSASTFPSAGQTVGFQIASNADIVVSGGAGTTGAPQSLSGTTVIQPI